VSLTIEDEYLSPYYYTEAEAKVKYKENIIMKAEWSKIEVPE